LPTGRDLLARTDPVIDDHVVDKETPTVVSPGAVARAADDDGRRVAGPLE
jgi:hypothetical protein